MKWVLIILCCLFLPIAYPQMVTYIVNSNKDSDDGVCDGHHCSLREAINAAEADNSLSKIIFDSTKLELDVLFLSSNLPTISHDGLIVDGRRGDGNRNVQIDLQFRIFKDLAAWSIQASNFHLRNICFKKIINFGTTASLIRIGDLNQEIRSCSITDCSFFEEATSSGHPFYMIEVQNCDNFILDHCNIGIDPVLNNIIATQSGASISQTNPNFISKITNNKFLNSEQALLLDGGNYEIKSNLFGAEDRSGRPNFLSPQSALLLGACNKIIVDSNFFMDYNELTIRCLDALSLIQISNNDFLQSSRNTIELLNSEIIADINHNDIMDCNQFLFVQDCKQLKVDSNSIQSSISFIKIEPIQGFTDFQHFGNIICTSEEPIINPNVFIPIIDDYDGKILRGKGTPNNVLVVCKRNFSECPMNCKGGSALGTIPIDASGDWSFPFKENNTDIISVYEYKPSNPHNMNASGFSNCDNTVLSKDINNSVQISMYPNPTNDELFLEDHNDSRILKDVKCVELLGHIHRQEFQITTTGKYKINTSELQTGVYSFIVRFDDLSQIVKRIIVE